MKTLTKIDLTEYFPNKEDKPMNIKIGTWPYYHTVGKGEYTEVSSKMVRFNGTVKTKYINSGETTSITISLALTNDTDCVFTFDGVSHSGKYNRSKSGKFLVLHFEYEGRSHIIKIEAAHKGSLFLFDHEPIHLLVNPK